MIGLSVVGFLGVRQMLLEANLMRSLDCEDEKGFQMFV